MKIVFEFAGGFRDGTKLIGDTDSPKSAAAYPFLTDNGTVDKIVTEMPPRRREKRLEMQIHGYGSVEYLRDWDELIHFSQRIRLNTRFNDGQSEVAIMSAFRDFRSKYPYNVIDEKTRESLKGIKRVAYKVIKRMESVDEIVVWLEHMGDVEEPNLSTN